MATIYDVAKYAGVSPTTVSSVLNDDPRVKDSTRVRVREAVEALGYVRNPNARGLAKRETKTIGIIAAIGKQLMPYEDKNENGPFIHAVSNGIIDRLAQTEYSVVTDRYRYWEADGELPQIVKNARVDGVILIGGLFDQEIIKKIRNHGIPMVGVCVIDDSIDTVNPDLAQGTYMVTEELLKNGCQNVVLLNAPRCYATSYTRREGWQQALQNYPSDSRQHVEVMVEAVTGGGGYYAMKKLWEQGLRPDGVVTAGETVSLGAMRFLAEQGVKIPQDTSMTAVGNSDLSAYAIPPITTVDIHEEATGAAAAELLLKRIKDPDAPIEQRFIDVTFIPRDSVCKMES
ncbi:MAG: LacI family DNA-binding transcriptional regulator [Lachnospiraceae bacterium]|nr:LacI family DNA-binding transcriptional regulator [Lachnospiraceae bacterium]